MSSLVLRSNKDKENVQENGKNSPGKNIDGAIVAPGKRKFGKYVYRFLRKLIENEIKSLSSPTVVLGCLAAGAFTVVINYFRGSQKARR